MTLERLPAVDGLRALAIAAVIATHAFPDGLPGGFLGVDVFFVISGYLITNILATEWAETGTIRFGAFARRRFFRIWPALATLLVFVLLLFALQPGLESRRWWVVVAALSLTNWATVLTNTDYGGLLRHTWSLSAEEQFYLVWPLGLIIGKWFNHRRGLVLGLVAAILLVTAWRIFLFDTGADGARLYKGFDTHSDGLLIGCLLAICRPNSWRQVVKVTWPVPAAILMIALPFEGTYSAFTLTVGLLIIPVSSAWLLWAVLERARGLEFLASAPFVWVGKRSYSLYLWHYPIFLCVAQLDLPAAMSLGVKLALTVAVAELSYRLIERPFLRLNERWASGTVARSGPATAS